MQNVIFVSFLIALACYYKAMMGRVFEFLVLLPVHVYRLFISPVMRPRCRFQPTCSEYAMAAVRAHGAWAGLWLSLEACVPVPPG